MTHLGAEGFTPGRRCIPSNDVNYEYAHQTYCIDGECALLARVSALPAVIAGPQRCGHSRHVFHHVSAELCSLG